MVQTRALFLVLATLLAPVIPATIPSPNAPAGFALDDAVPWNARLVSIDSSYGQEDWKYGDDYDGQASPDAMLSHVSNQTTSYAGALGLKVTIELEICYSFGNGTCRPASDQTQDVANFSVSAYIDTSRGRLYAMARRESGPGATPSRSFFLDFDMDGSNNGDPRGQFLPAADPGLQRVKVSIVERERRADPVVPRGNTEFQFTYALPFTSPVLQAGLFPPAFQEGPDTMFRPFTDIGFDRSLWFLTAPLPSDNATNRINVTYDFGPRYRSSNATNPNQTVELVAYEARRGVESPTGQQGPAPLPTAPFVPGVSDNETLRKVQDLSSRFVIVDTAVIGTNKTDPNGRVWFDVPLTDLTGAASTFVVLAPRLVGDFALAACPGVAAGRDCKGGAEYRFGATELLLPFTDQAVLIDEFILVDQDVSGSGAPEPIRDAALAANALTVIVQDPAGFQTPSDHRAGDIFALVPDVRNAEPLSGASLSPSQEDLEEQHLLQGNLQIRPLHTQRITHYRVFAFLYAASDVFYGMASADRGYTIELSTSPAPAPGDTNLTVRLTSRTTNYDDYVGDPAFDISVIFRVEIPEFNIDEVKTVTLDEGTAPLVEVYQVHSEQAGDSIARVNSTSGDVLPGPQSLLLTWTEPAPEKGLADRVPGFEATLGVPALALAFMFAWRRRLRA